MQKNRLSISIITISFNSAKNIQRTIESVLAQQNPHYEYLIVDGGSTDGTLDIIKAFEPRFEGRMRWISEPDNGIYDAFNKGIKMAKEDYIWFVNSDDYIEKDAIATIHQFIQEGQYHDNVLSFACNYVENDGTFIFLCSSNHQKALNSFKKDYMGCPHPSVVVAKSIYEGGFLYDANYKIIGDIDWFHRIMIAQIPVVFSSDIISNFTRGGISTANNSNKRTDYRYYFQKNYPNLMNRLYHSITWKIRDRINQLKKPHHV